MARTTSTGSVACRSHRSAWGAISLSANSLTTLAKAASSSLGSKSMELLGLARRAECTVGRKGRGRMPGTEHGGGRGEAQSGDHWVAIREVGPRDGLQVEAPMALEERVSLITSLVDCGLDCVEVAAFVSPQRVPSMAGAADVVRAVAEVPATCFVLVPNLRGAQMALDAGAEAVTVTVSASEAYSVSNVGRGRDEAATEVAKIIGLLAG